MNNSTSPVRQPLERFLALAQAFKAESSWSDDTELQRWAAIVLSQSERGPAELVHATRAIISDWRSQVRWWRDTAGSARAFLAATLVLDSLPVSEFLRELERVRDRFRALRLPRSGLAESLALAVLLRGAKDARVDDARLQRIAELYQRVKQDHRFLLGSGDLPTLALLATTDESANEIGRRVEELYEDLRSRGFRASSALLAIPHLLFFHPTSDRRACTRFEELWNQFKEQGLHMHSGDYDELALLSFAPGAPSGIAKRVLAHRERIRGELRPKPGRDAGFSLACATTFLELSERAPSSTRLAHLQAVMQVRSVIVARQAAMAAASSGAH